MADWQAINADVPDWAAGYDGPKFHALFCDPPYHLTSITRRFGKPGSAPAKFGRDGAFTRASNGFMGQAWDGLDESGQGIAFRPETWAALAEHLYPGAFVMAFAASRGWHRMAVALEDAGLIIHPSVFMLGYAFGSGFPKATRIDTQVDRQNGLERPDKLQGGHIGMGRHAGDADNENELENTVPHVVGKGNHTNGTPLHPLAQTWQGHRYGLQAMKPALEPIILAQKPYEGRPVDDITATGAGALNVDGARIGTSDSIGSSTYQDIRGDSYAGMQAVGRDRLNGRLYEQHSAGRWPSNLILQHTPACTRNGDEWQCADGCPVKRLGEQSGESVSTGGINVGGLGDRIYGKYAKDQIGESAGGFGDSGTAARFFYQADWSCDIYEQLASADPVYYTAKASTTERNAGLDSLPTRTRNRVNPGGLENEPRWAPTQAKNIHPTVKPISLTKYLATLLLPPAAYAPRRILCPFSGSGSEMIGALLAGWDEVIGIEQSPEYWQISQARLAWWADWLTWGQTDVDAILAAAGEEAKGPAAEQLGLF